jgi:hypothetical protein
MVLMMNDDFLFSNSKVQVYATYRKRQGEGDGVIWVCHRCVHTTGPLGNGRSDLVFGSKGDLLVHLHNHQRDRHGIPDELLTRLAREIHEEEQSGQVMVVGEPEWQQAIHRSTGVTAFRWDLSQGDCLPEISKLGNSFLLMTKDGDVPLSEGDWVVRSATGELWRVASAMFDRLYNRIGKERG